MINHLINLKKQPKDYKKINLAIIGAGHAGLDAATVISNTLTNQPNLTNCIITDNQKFVGKLACNPSIGGIGKSQLVYESAVLNSITALATDKSAIHADILTKNIALRLQVDTKLYTKAITFLIKKLKTELIITHINNLQLHNKKFKIITPNLIIVCDQILICPGVFNRAIFHIGDCNTIFSKNKECIYRFLRQHNIKTNRFKTGTCPRIMKYTINWKLTSPIPTAFPKSGFISKLKTTQLCCNCRTTNINKPTYNTIKLYSKLSAIFLGKITSTGPKHCPSIETKIHKSESFETSYQKIIIEPEGLRINQVYLNGLSTALPFEVQIVTLRQITCFKSCKIVLPGYNVEYDYLNATAFNHNLEIIKIKNMYTAGQINGTTGYEEASAQGIGVAIMIVNNLNKMKNYSCLATLINYITNQIITKPYRILTHTIKNRTNFRQCNVYSRLIPIILKLNTIRNKLKKIITWILTKNNFTKNTSINKFKNNINIKGIKNIHISTYIKTTTIHIDKHNACNYYTYWYDMYNTQTPYLLLQNTNITKLTKFKPFKKLTLSTLHTMYTLKQKQTN